MGCGRSRVHAPTTFDNIQDRPIQVHVMFGTNARSPGKTSPTGVIGSRDGAGVGRTMKEYEDQLEALKKENFNLKLRIYFLEERMGITSADENAIKKNIELKVEIESLRKELVEKQELLSQAAKAFELIEEQKEASSRNQAQYQQSLENEREKIRRLEKELAEYEEKKVDASIFYKEAFGITPEKALENEEKLCQMEELVASLEAEFENGYVKRSPPSSPSAMNSVEDPLQARMGQKMSCVQGMTKRGNTCLDWEPNRERSTRVKSPVQTLNGEIRDIRDLIKELEEKEKELKAQEESRKQLVLKLCNTQKQAETMSYKLKKLEGEHEKAIKTIQGFMERQQQLENTKLRKEQKIMELEIELNRLREYENAKAARDGHDQFVLRDFSTDMTDDPERDASNQRY